MNRKEYKFIMSNEELNEFFKSNYQNLNSIYANRKIKNLYFDTLGFNVYSNNLFNDSEKFTYRFRKYNTQNIYKEIKINKEKKSKITTETKYGSFNEIQYATYENKLLYPTVFTEYYRCYLSLKNTRVTIDKNIKFSSHQFRTKVQKSKVLNFNILEFKLLDVGESLDIEKNFFKNPQGFSKFRTAVGEIYNI